MKTFIIFGVVLLVACGAYSDAKTTTECPAFCTADYSPVCAKDAQNVYQTFSNRCQLGVHNECTNPKHPFVEVYEGACRKV